MGHMVSVLAIYQTFFLSMSSAPPRANVGSVTVDVLEVFNCHSLTKLLFLTMKKNVKIVQNQK